MVLAALVSSPIEAHDGHHHHSPETLAHHGASDEALPSQDDGGDTAQRTTGSGAFTFRHRPLTLPEAMRTHLRGAHGGFAPDPEVRGGTGSTYFSLKGVGLMRIEPDLSAIEVIGGDPSFVGVNLHNTCLFREAGETYLALPSDQAQKVFITDTSGKLIRTFGNPYGSGKGAFRVCDLEYVDGILFAANGYADNVCFTCNPLRGASGDPGLGSWNEFRFGGKGKIHGRFGTAHGVTRVPGTDVFTIADRANSRLESFTSAGRFIGGVKLPAGCMPCDVDYHGKYAVVGCLKGPGGSTPAPIYILEDGNIIAELNIGKDLGVPGFKHIHNAAFHVIRDRDGKERIFVLAYAWNPGAFAVLEQVPAGG